MSDPRPITPDEGRAEFFAVMAAIFKYWRDLPTDQLHPSDAGESEIHTRMSGFLFSLLVALDGGNAALPAFDIVPAAHPADEAYCKQQGENWWVPQSICTTSLHETFPWASLKGAAPWFSPDTSK